MGMINIGAGLSALGNSVAETAGHMALETQKSNMEEQKLRLADQLAGERAWKAPGVAEDIEGKQLGLQQRKNAISSFQALMGGSPASSATDDAFSSTSSPSVKPTGGDAPALPKGVNALPDSLKAQMANAFALSGGDPTEPLKIYGKWVEEQNKVFDQRKDNRLITGGGELVGSANLQNNPNQPFNSDGTPNQAFQDWELKKQAAGKTTEGAKRVMLNDSDGTPYTFDLNTPGSALTLDGKPYAPKSAARLGSSGVGGALTDAQATYFAETAHAGDPSVFTMVGRNQAARLQVAQKLVEIAHAKGETGVDLATAQAAFAGDKQAQRAIGSRTAAITVSGAEAENMAQLVKDAYDKLPRGQFKPFNQLEALWSDQTNSPEQGQAYAADFSMITAYARALNPQGVPREADIEQGKKILNAQGDSIAKHDAVVDQWLLEIKKIKEATGTAKLENINQIRQRNGLEPIKAAAPTTNNPAKVYPTPPPAAIQDLKAGKGTPTQFDEIFGPGAAEKAK